MSIRICRLFPERPLARKDYPGGVLRATLQWGSPPPAGCVRFTDRPNELTPPQQRDFSNSLHVALGLTVPEGAVSGPGGLPWCLFHSDLPPGFEGVSEGGPC